MKKFLKRLLGTGLYLLNHPDRVKKTAIDRADDHLDDLGDLAQEKYQSVADIVASRFRRHRDRDEDSHAFRNAVRMAAGVGNGCVQCRKPRSRLPPLRSARHQLRLGTFRHLGLTPSYEADHPRADV